MACETRGRLINSLTLGIYSTSISDPRACDRDDIAGWFNVTHKIQGSEV